MDLLYKIAPLVFPKHLVQVFNQIVPSDDNRKGDDKQLVTNYTVTQLIL